MRRCRSWIHNSYRKGLILCLVFVLLGLHLVGCVQEGQIKVKVGEIITEEPIRPSPLGSFLAGKIARKHNDTAAAADFFRTTLDSDQQNQVLIERVLFLLLAEGRIKQAGDFANRRIAVKSSAAMARLALSVKKIHAGDFDGATEHLSSMSDAGFGVFLKPMLLAWTQMGQGDKPAALKTLELLATSKAFDGFRRYHESLIHDISGDQEAALKAFELALAADSLNEDRRKVAYGSLLTRMGKWEVAAKLFQSHLQTMPENPVINQAYHKVGNRVVLGRSVNSVRDGVAEVFLGAASVLSRQSPSESAKIYARFAIHLRPKLGAATLVLGQLLDSDGLYLKANELYNGLTGVSASAWEAQIRRAINFERMGRIEDALTALSDMAGVRPNDVSPLIAAADILRANKRFVEATKIYDRVLGRIKFFEERHWTLLYARGVALERSKRWAEAEKDFLRALELKPNQPLVLNYLGYSWAEQGVKLRQAKEMIENAVQQRPNDGYIVDSLGWVYYRMGMFTDATIQLEKAVQLRPDDPTINEHLGDTYWQVGRFLEARFQWRHALSLGSEEQKIKELKKKISEGLPTSSSRKNDG